MYVSKSKHRNECRRCHRRSKAEKGQEEDTMKPTNLGIALCGMESKEGGRRVWAWLFLGQKALQAFVRRREW